MLTLQIPMLLALLGTALMAVVIFAPARTVAPVTMSFAPPPAPPLFEQWEPFPFDHSETSPVDPFAQSSATTSAAAVATWPALVDPRAAGCDSSARLGLVEALATVRAPWSETILCRALDDEPDPAVHTAIAAALR